jgi:hypothetical protein
VCLCNIRLRGRFPAKSGLGERSEDLANEIINEFYKEYMDSVFVDLL